MGRCLALSFLLSIVPLLAASGDGWPQLLGPERNATLAGEVLPHGPLTLELLWSRPLGAGYSSLTVQNRRLYTLDSDHESDFAVALDAATGEEIWRRRLGPTYEGHGGSEDGPTSTPTVDGGRLFVVTPHGELLALDRADGAVRWRRDLVEDFGAEPPTWSFATSPLVEGRRLLVQVGGSEHNLVAFDKATGEVLWAVDRDTRLHYSSPTTVSLAGTLQTVVAGESEIYAVRAETGELLWSLEARQADKEMPVSLSTGDDDSGRLFVPTWNEGLLVEVERVGEGPAATDEEKVGRASDGRWTARALWTTPFLKHSYSPTVEHRGALFRFNRNVLTCFDPESEEVVWRQRLGEGSLIRLDDHLVVWSEGKLRLAPADPAGYRETAALTLSNPPSRTVIPPAFADGVIYVRHPERIFAVRVVSSGPGPSA